MRLRAAVVIAAAVLSAGTVGAQVAWVGGGFGATWEYQPEVDPGRTWLRGEENAYSLYVAVPLDEATSVRFAAWDVPHIAPYGGTAWPGQFRAYTLGVDYFVPGVFGQAVFSAGAGQYRFDPVAQDTPERFDDDEFGWYVGIGEWFQLSHRTRLTVEVSMHRPDTDSKPVLATVLAGLAVAF